MTRLQADVALDVQTVNVEVLKWLRDVPNVRNHRGTGKGSIDRLKAEQQDMPYEPAAEATARLRLSRVPLESLQHPLSV